MVEAVWRGWGGDYCRICEIFIPRTVGDRNRGDCHGTKMGATAPTADSYRPETPN